MNFCEKFVNSEQNSNEPYLMNSKMPNNALQKDQRCIFSNANKITRKIYLPNFMSQKIEI